LGYHAPDLSTVQLELKNWYKNRGQVTAQLAERQELFLNIVRARYNESSEFLATSSISTQFSIDLGASASAVSCCARHGSNAGHWGTFSFPYLLLLQI